MPALVNPYMTAVAAPPVVVTDYRATYSSAVDALQYVYAAQDFGTPSAGRYILVAFAGRGASVRTITSVLLGGVTATQLALLNSGSTTLAIYGAAVPTGATGDIEINLSGNWVRMVGGVWAATGLASLAAFDNENDVTMVANQLAVAIDCPANGAIIGVCVNGNAGAWTWGGITKRFDTSIEAGNNQISGASLDFATIQTGLSVTANQVNTASSPGLLVISLTP